MELTSITAMEVVCFALIFHNCRWERSMTKNLHSCVPGYKCWARPKFEWTRDHPKAVDDISSLSKKLLWTSLSRTSNIYSLFLPFLPWTALMDELGVGSFPDTINKQSKNNNWKYIYVVTLFNSQEQSILLNFNKWKWRNSYENLIFTGWVSPYKRKKKKKGIYIYIKTSRFFFLIKKKKKKPKS